MTNVTVVELSKPDGEAPTIDDGCDTLGDNT